MGIYTVKLTFRVHLQNTSYTFEKWWPLKVLRAVNKGVKVRGDFVLYTLVYSNLISNLYYPFEKCISVSFSKKKTPIACILFILFIYFLF